MIGPAEIERFRGLLAPGRPTLLVTHLNPDGDAIGSEIGLAELLVAHGVPVRIVNQDPTPEILRFVEAGGDGAEAYDPGRHDAVVEAAARIVLLDNSAPDRLGRMEPIVSRHAAKTFCIDHHPTRGTPWAETIIDERWCATAAMIFELSRAVGFVPTPRGARALYAGLASDTGFFRFNSTSPRAHEIAAELLRLGADPAACYRALQERNAPAYTRLTGHALAGLRLDADGRLASVRITRAMIEACEAQDQDTSEVTTPVLATDGVQVAILFRELPDGRVKVSLRSKGEVDVHGLATEFGGGGHRNASGIVLSEPIDAVTETIIGRAKALLGPAR